MDLLTQVQPASPENERAVLGSMMVDHMAALTAMETLQPGDFYERPHRTIYDATSRVINNGGQADAMSVEGMLSDMGRLEEAGGTGYLMELMRSVSSANNIEHFVDAVKRKAKARRLISDLQKSIARAYDPEEDIESVLSGVETSVYGLMVGDQSGQMYDMQRTMKDTLDQIRRVQEVKDGVVGLPSGLPYDQTLAGFQKAKMYVIAGRPGMGKTAFMLQNILNIAMKGHSCGVISLEMGYMSLGSRLLLSHAGVDAQRANTGKLNQGEMHEVEKSAKKLRDLGIVIDDTTDLDPSVLRIKARMMKQIHKIDLLAVDYVQLMRADNDSREQQVAEISRTCKALSKELNIPVLALAQLSRKPDDRKGWATRPELSDLRESGSLEQDADVVMFLYQPKKYGLDRYPGPPDGDGSKTDGITEVLIRKHRDGPTGSWRLEFQPHQMRFLPLTQDTRDVPVEIYEEQEPF